MKSLKIGISGVRGIVGETFTPELVVSFAEAFGTYMDSGRVLVCRDSRSSGPMALSAVTAGLISTGCEVIDLGICPTPSLQLAVRWLEAQGGISITAGHNPEPWNALKFIRADGLYLNATQADELLDVYHQAEFAKATWEKIQSRIDGRDAIRHHIETLKQAFDVEAIRNRRLKVAVDCCNSSCALLSPLWLTELGCNVFAVNDDLTAPFPHRPEPKPETMAQLRAVVMAGNADIGFAHDADGERLGIVTEDGETLSEETTLALATEIALRQKSGAVVTNISTSRTIDTIAERHGGSVIRTPVGQAFISEAMIENGAVIGGEGNGGVVVPRIQWSHDSAATIGLILEHLAQSGERLPDIVSQLPHYVMLKHYLPVEPNRIYSVMQRMYAEVEKESGLAYDLTDGIKVSFPDGWVHIRVSNTESMIRIIAEGSNQSRANELLDWGRDRLSR